MNDNGATNGRPVRLPKLLSEQLEADDAGPKPAALDKAPPSEGAIKTAHPRPRDAAPDAPAETPLRNRAASGAPATTLAKAKADRRAGASSVTTPDATGTPVIGSEACPLCDSPIPKAKYDRILRIDEARKTQQAAQLAALEREREELHAQREQIVRDAVEAERETWKRRADRLEASATRHAAAQHKAAEAQIRKLTQMHERKFAQATRRQQQHDKELASKLAAAQARADKELQQRLRQAQREGVAQQRRQVEGLRAQIQTEQQRRVRDEAGWKQKIAELQQKSERRDAAHFGPESETELARVLREQFGGDGDKIERIATDGDVLHTVCDGGRKAGLILYEAKKRRDFQRAYVRQTRKAMEVHGTRFGMLVSRVMPKGVTGVCVMDDVVVVAPELAVAVAGIVREGMVAIARLQLSEEGKKEKAELLFEFVRSEQFGNAMQLVGAKVTELRDSMARERSLHDGWWHTRENAYASILRATSVVAERVREVLARGTREAGG